MGSVSLRVMFRVSVRVTFDLELGFGFVEFLGLVLGFMLGLRFILGLMFILGLGFQLGLD